MKYTLQQIRHAEKKSGNEFVVLIQYLKLLGVARFITYVTDGHTDYFDDENGSVSGAATNNLLVSDNTHAESFIQRLKLHQNGETDFPTFREDCAKNGIDRWTVDVTKMTCTYLDQKGNKILVEEIPNISL